ncbi:MAG: hypothetical protein K9M56_04225 [Victivallales bacterium]|nr:hypothetical protein [Victivallales bacterium]
MSEKKNTKNKKDPLSIPESHEGRFTRWSKRHGFKTVQDAAKHVLANKNDYSTHVVKMATYARNAKTKWNQ